MTRTLLALSLFLAFAGCDDPTARKYLAQCELAPAAHIPNSDNYDFLYLEKCMQAKGYVEDERIRVEGRKRCFVLLYSFQNAACYRPDNELARLLYENF